MDPFSGSPTTFIQPGKHLFGIVDFQLSPRIWEIVLPLFLGDCTNRAGVGSTIPNCPGHLVPTGVDTPHQYFGTESHNNLTTMDLLHSRPVKGTVGECHSCGLHKPPGKNFRSRSYEQDKLDPLLGRGNTVQHSWLSTYCQCLNSG